MYEKKGLRVIQGFEGSRDPGFEGETEGWRGIAVIVFVGFLEFTGYWHPSFQAS